MSEPLLRAVSLSKRFGGLQANADISFDVNPGEVVGIFGPNGAGKSTLFDLITGFTPPDSGRVTLGADDITGRAPAWIGRRGVARTFQKLKPFVGLTVLDNVLVGAFSRTSDAKAARWLALDALDAVHLVDKRHSFARELSTGQRKRLELARAIATQPRIVLMDEITGGVDQRTIPELVALVIALKQRGVSVITIEHNLRVLMQVCDRLLALHAGRVIAFGTPAEVRAHPAVLHAYLGDHRVAAAA